MYELISVRHLASFLLILQMPVSWIEHNEICCIDSGKL